MKYTIIVVHYHAKEHLFKCLRSIPKEQDIEKIIVVDNGSTSGFAEELLDEFSNIELIQNPGNLGYGASVNRAVNEANGDWLLILNQDVELEDGSFEGLARSINANDRIGIWGARLFNSNGTEQGSAGPFPSGVLSGTYPGRTCATGSAR